MVNEVNKLILNTLLEYNAVTLPSVGSLVVVRHAAKMEGKSRVVAPSYGVEFKSAECGYSVVDAIVSVANVEMSEANDIYLRWLDKVKEGNTLNISGVGTLKNKSFVADNALLAALNPATAKVVTIHRRRSWTVVAIAASIVVLLGVGAWLYMNNSRVATPIVAEEVVVAETMPEVAVIEAPEEVVEAEQPEVVETPVVTKWVDRDDLRHWVVVGSYSTRENAQRAIDDIVRKEKAECCDTLMLGKMYAVAVFGSDDKVECERFVRDNRHIFSQSWVHTPKRFK